MRGREHIPSGAALVAGKHQSFWETFAILPLLDDPAMVLKKELTYIPFFGWFIFKFKMIAVERSAGSAALKNLMRRAEEEIARGRQVVIMPEGTRRAPDDPPDYKPGAAALYGILGVPCVPFALNSGLFWPRRKFLRHPGTIVIEFLPPIPAGLPRKAFQARLQEAIETATARLVAEGRSGTRKVQIENNFSTRKPIGVTHAQAMEPAGLNPIAQEIWDMKYRFKETDGTIHDQTPQDTFRRVAKAVAAAEAGAARAGNRRSSTFLSDYRFLPAGRILSGAGTGRSVTLFNCFVMGRIEDSMAGIFDALKEAALTMQQGGGIGHDFSTIRPAGAPVKGVGADASGPLSFMDVWDSMCRTIMSAGSRRGAMMGTMRCDHPDIEAFIAAKRDARRLRNFNLSVLVTDAFMAAVKADAQWPLVFEGKTYRTLRRAPCGTRSCARPMTAPSPA